ncbi:MAG: ABC transporter substrate-binding protein [Proteobacteria bacterium]|nr:ABC transporter substrate-binding protein [Pseudomonadota bacterium]
MAVSLPGSSEAADPVRGGTLEYAVVGWPNTLDCHGATSYAVLHYVSPHYSLLVKFDQDRYPEVKADLAESWTVSPDGLTYTFKLRRNVVFHDGTPLTSADVKASFDRLMVPPPGVISASQALFDAVKSVAAPDPFTIVFTLKRPQSYFLSIVAYPANCIYSAKRLAADPLFPSKEVMGTGPFVHESHVQGSHWIGKRFDRYFLAGQPYLDGFRAIAFSQNSAVASGLQSGQVMAEFRGFAPPVRDRLKAAMGDKIDVQESTWALSITLTFNSERPPFNDARVRRALNMSIDRWTAADNLSKIATVKSVGATQRPGSPWAASNDELTTLPGFSRDMASARAEARRLLAEAGQEKLKFKLANRSVPDPYTAVGVYLIDQWRRIGVEVEQQFLELKVYDVARAGGEYDAIVEYTNALVDDPELELVKYISRDRSPLSFGRYTDRELDGLFDQIATSQDVPKRQTLTRAFEKRLADQAYMMPVLWMQRITLMSSRVRGWRITPTHLVNQDLVDVWLAP